MNIKKLVQEIKKSKKYKDISEEVIENKIKNYSEKNIGFDEKAIVKGVKALLHDIHSSFQVSTRKVKERDELFKQLEKEPKSIDIIKKILATNKSTHERLSVYSELYARIFEITGKPRNIMDLGCGLNPVSLPFMAIYPENYYCYDINESDTRFLNNFFKISKAFGVAKNLDLSNIENIKKLPSDIDICFMFKLIDTLEKEKGREGHKYSEEIIKILAEKCKFIVISFATRTISGREMNYPQRGWIERMLERIGMKFEKIYFNEAGEVFYVVRRM